MEETCARASARLGPAEVYVRVPERFAAWEVTGHDASVLVAGDVHYRIFWADHADANNGDVTPRFFVEEL